MACARGSSTSTRESAASRGATTSPSESAATCEDRAGEEHHMTEKGLHLFLGGYPSAEGAHPDYHDLTILHNSGRFGTYDAAVVVKDEQGKVHIKKREKP